MEPGQSAQPRKPAAGLTGLACAAVRRERSVRGLPLIPKRTPRTPHSGNRPRWCCPRRKKRSPCVSMPTCCAGSAANAAIRPASMPSCAPTCRRIGRKARSQLGASVRSPQASKGAKVGHPPGLGKKNWGTSRLSPNFPLSPYFPQPDREAALYASQSGEARTAARTRVVAIEQLSQPRLSRTRTAEDQSVAEGGDDGSGCSAARISAIVTRPLTFVDEFSLISEPSGRNLPISTSEGWPPCEVTFF
jgi:hypothetical protein